MPKLPWFERKFDFTYPVALFPDIIERLRGTPARLEDRVRDLSLAILTCREGNSWSIQENIGHLIDLDDLHRGRLDDYAKHAATLRAADLTNKKTHEAHHNDRPLPDLLAAFRQERGGLVERVEALPEAEFARTALHPRLRQPMRLVDCLFFCAAHDDYHLARITELMRLFRVS